jgi:hypothetical protein
MNKKRETWKSHWGMIAAMIGTASPPALAKMLDRPTVIW